MTLHMFADMIVGISITTVICVAIITAAVAFTFGHKRTLTFERDKHIRMLADKAQARADSVLSGENK